MLYLLMIDGHQVWFQSSGEGCNQCCSYLQVEFLFSNIFYILVVFEANHQSCNKMSADFIFHIKSYLLIVKQIALLCLLFFVCWQKIQMQISWVGRSTSYDLPAILHWCSLSATFSFMRIWSQLKPTRKSFQFLNSNFEQFAALFRASSL